VVLWIEPKPSCWLGKHSTTEPHPRLRIHYFIAYFYFTGQRKNCNYNKYFFKYKEKFLLPEKSREVPGLKRKDKGFGFCFSVLGFLLRAYPSLDKHSTT
jgi:hypothetical protein